MKLLMAPCDALGFEVERETVYTINSCPLESVGVFNLISAGDVSKIDSEASYKLIEKTADNKKQRKKNLITCISAEYGSGYITLDEYIAKLRDLDENL